MRIENRRLAARAVVTLLVLAGAIPCILVIRNFARRQHEVFAYVRAASTYTQRLLPADSPSVGIASGLGRGTELLITLTSSRFAHLTGAKRATEAKRAVDILRERGPLPRAVRAVAVALRVRSDGGRIEREFARYIFRGDSLRYEWRGRR